MKVFVVLAHPEPQSLNASLARYAVEVLEGAGHEVKVSDLYAMNWKAVVDVNDFLECNQEERLNIGSESLRCMKNGTLTPDVIAEQEKLRGGAGWVDRVYAAGFAYFVGERTPTRHFDKFGDGTLAGKRAMCMVTAGGTAAHFSARGINGPMDDVLWIQAAMKERLLTLDTTEPIPYRKQNYGDYTIPDLQLQPGLEQEGDTGFDIHIKRP
ncbi:flavo protein [Coccomyxa subellipsoidea C-169]|uniref:Flavo protein n=1 Tax=Coccomyxa subellipsoidea (strain C-169) TaxID=574566 RepID=I0YY11_COCSC|nr:flavo protein [Coccomyxa subellipsoidea C-169]EIE23280.1 flavo protein [Coccomyxa subellipsoidea C-169]|eukprot:XP_005647824.1 flavo protein [Coccomyxa subellipsoidea C-169]